MEDVHDEKPSFHLVDNQSGWYSGPNSTSIVWTRNWPWSLHKLDKQLSEATITSDPYASVSFFHFMINAILWELLGIRGYKHAQLIQRGKGILGIIEAYMGTIEAQGWGTLHLHMVLWLRGSMLSDKMKEVLLTEEFCTKVKSFITCQYSCGSTKQSGNIGSYHSPGKPCLIFMSSQSAVITIWR